MANKKQVLECDTCGKTIVCNAPSAYGSFNIFNEDEMLLTDNDEMVGKILDIPTDGVSHFFEVCARCAPKIEALKAQMLLAENKLLERIKRGDL